ncbi:uncharacterized protein RAG0_17631 [Rhynchosporium agropyri]|uniref:Uncharacterized protein n=1 Tax=Rhynchosporium agropyri TaxID=914238 RepID=A0A1E1LTY5_9HELO|nr:uncharacterized protein RAG0_17631 [Rhynchosporium agropyri]
MKAFTQLLVLSASTITVVLAAAIAEEHMSNMSLNQRNVLTKRKWCWKETGIDCFYDGGYCYWHSCNTCTCWDTVAEPINNKGPPLGQSLSRHECRGKGETKCTKF